MALPAGRYGVTKNQLLKIKKLPMNTIKLIEELTEKFNLLGTAAFKNSTAVVTESSDLVESGAVKDIVGWGNKNLWKFGSFTGAYSNIPLSLPAGTYTFSFSSNSPVGIRMFYNENDSVVFSGESPFNIVLEQPVVKINYSCNDSIATNVQLEVGSTATAYEPYHASVEESKCDNSVIGTVEDGTTASQAYAVGSHAIRNGAFITWKNAKAQGETINDASDYTSGDVAECLVKKDTFSGTTSTGGNIALGNTRKILSAFVTDANKTYIALPYINGYNGENAVHIVQANTQTQVVAEETVSGIYYYID